MNNPNARAARSVVDMMPRCFLAACALLVVLAGCQKNGELVMNPKPAEPVAPKPTGPETKPPEVVIPPEAFKIEPGTKSGYSPSKTALSAIGQSTDAGILGLRNGKAVAVMIFEGPRGKLNGNVDIKVRDDKTFMVGYLLPQTDATPNRILGDGHEKVINEGRELKAIQPSTASGAMTSAEIDKWIEFFPREMFADLQAKGDVWNRLLAGLQADPSNYHDDRRAAGYDEKRQASDLPDRLQKEVVGRRERRDRDRRQALVASHCQGQLQGRKRAGCPHVLDCGVVLRWDV